MSLGEKRASVSRPYSVLRRGDITRRKRENAGKGVGTRDENTRQNRLGNLNRGSKDTTKGSYRQRIYLLGE